MDQYEIDSVSIPVILFGHKSKKIASIMIKWIKKLIKSKELCDKKFVFCSQIESNVSDWGSSLRSKTFKKL